MKRFLTLFPAAENVHLTKDVGMIPYILHRDFGYDATLACYNNGSYPYLEKEVKGLKIAFIKKITGNSFVDSLIFLLLNFRRFDVLQLYHLERASTILLTLFKILKFGRGTTYLKLDIDERILTFSFKTILGRIHKYLLSKVNCISIENGILHQQINDSNLLGRRVELITNGYFENDEAPTTIKKENKFLTVGRIGTFQKNNEVLLEAFAIFSKHNKDWTLELVGKIAPEFNNYIENYFARYPELKDRISFSGFIADKKLLADKYNQAKVFVLTSRYEGMSLAYIEAMYAGCLVISSDILAARYTTNNGEFGDLFDVGDVDRLASLMLNATQNEKRVLDRSQSAKAYAKKKFNWVAILQTLYDELEGRGHSS